MTGVFSVVQSPVVQWQRVDSLVLEAMYSDLEL